MKSIIYLLILALLSSCSNNSVIFNEIIRTNDHAREQLENQIYFIVNNAVNMSQESKKYLPINSKLQEVFIVYEKICNEDSYCLSHTDSLMSKMLKNLSSDFDYLNLERFSTCLEIDDGRLDELKTSVLRLQLASLFQYYCIVYTSDIESFGLRFWGFTDLTTCDNGSQYSFSILSDDIQRFKHKNYQIDSVFVNGHRHYVNSKIVPSVCANIFIDSTDKGKYSVYGHADLYDEIGTHLIPFSHEFTVTK